MSLVERMVAPANNFLDHMADLEERVQRLERYPDAGSDGSAAALADESYLVLGFSTDLSNERVLTVGNGLVDTDLGAGSTYTVALGTPSSVSVLSANLATGGTHYHEVETSSNPGATQVILATALDGGLQLLRLGIGTDPDTDNAVKVVNGTWFGLGSAAGRIVIVDAATDQVQIQTADLYLATGYGIVHQTNVTAGYYLRADGTRYVPNTIQAADLPGSFSGFANPTGTIGLAAVNGVLTTAMRSDAAPPLSQAIIPTWTQLHTYAAGIAFSGATTANFLRFPNNLADGLHISDAGAVAIEYVKFASTDAQPFVAFNDAAVDVDFRFEAVGVTDALLIQGSDGQITLGVLGAGYVKSTAGGVLSSGAIALADVPVHNLFSATHGDTVVQGATRGSLVYGNATPAWDELVLGGAAGSVVTRNATDVVWSGYYLAGTAGQTYTFGTTGGTIPTAAGTLTTATLNAISAAGVITHAITSSSAPGAATSILKSGATGELALTGILSLAEYMDHIGDTDTYWRFQADNITIRAGGVDMVDIVEAATDYVNFPAGLIFVNDTSNVFMTAGITINVGAGVNEAAAFKAVEVAHGITDYAETDTFGDILAIQYGAAGSGGISIRGFSEATAACALTGVGTTDNTAKTSAARGYVEIYAHKKSGTGITAPGADSNLLIIASGANVRFIFDQEGSAHAEVEWTTFDDYDDMALLADLETAMLAQRDPVKAQFADFLRYNRAGLEQAGIVHFGDTPGHAMVNFTRLSMLLVGAIGQLATRLPA